MRRTLGKVLTTNSCGRGIRVAPCWPNAFYRLEPMQITTLLLHTGQLPYEIQYVCPICDSSNYDILPESLASLSCENCGAELDGTHAQIEIIAVRRTSPTPGI